MAAFLLSLGKAYPSSSLGYLVLAFLAAGDKVHIRVVLKGREMAHQEIGEELMRRFIALLEEGGPVIIEKAPSWEGKCYSCIVTSKSKK